MSKHLVVSEKRERLKANRERYLARDRMCSKCSLHKAMRSSAWCKHCSSEYDRRRWSLMSGEQRKEEHLKKKYKIDLEIFNQMFDEQQGLCKTCSVPLEIFVDISSRNRACVDHDHSTGKVRGLLCNHCNRALGLIEDNLETLKKMQEYLQ